MFNYIIHTQARDVNRNEENLTNSVKISVVRALFYRG